MFSFGIGHIKAVSGGYSIPGLKFYYTAHQLHELFDHYGSIGISDYLKLQWIDMFYPIVYSLLLSSLLFLFFNEPKPKPIIYVPFLAAMFDYAENILLHSIAESFPVFNNTLARFAALCTAWKWLLIYLSILFIFYGLGKRIVVRIKK